MYIQHGKATAGHVNLGFDLWNSGRGIQCEFAMISSNANSFPSPSFFLVAAPWDFSGPTGGIDAHALGEILDRLQGDVGLTGLSIWGASAAYDEFRVHKKPHWIRCDGGLFFDPVQSRGGCRPPESSVSRRFLPEIASVCQQHNASLRCMLSYASLGGLAHFYPEFASQNAFGDVSRASVCLLNPAVQDCMQSITCAIPPQFGVCEVVLHDVLVGWLEAFDITTRWPSPLGMVERSMVSTCFCPACVGAGEEAGIEVDSARIAVTNLVSRSLVHGTSFAGTESGFLAEHPALEAFRRAQFDRLNRFILEIAEDSPREVLVARKALSPLAFDPGIPAGVITEALSLSEAGNVACTEARRNEVTVPASCLLGSRSEEFIGATANLPRWGYTGVQIDGFHSLPESSWTTLRQAIRFARRSFAR